jgi:hypothetical protein
LEGSRHWRARHIPADAPILCLPENDHAHWCGRAQLSCAQKLLAKMAI